MQYEGGQSESSQMLPELQTTQDIHVEKPCQNHEASAGMELPPLLTSTSFWSDVSAVTIERVCLRPPLPSLVQFILQSSWRRNTPVSIDTDNRLEYSATASGIT